MNNINILKQSRGASDRTDVKRESKPTVGDSIAGVCKKSLLVIFLLGATCSQIVSGQNVSSQEKAKPREQGRIAAAPVDKKTMDSIKLHYLAEIATKYPILRSVSVGTDVIGNSTIRSNLYGKSFFDGKVHSARTAVNVNIPVIAWGKNSFSISLGFLQQHISLNDVKTYNTTLPVLNSVINRGTANFALSYGRADSLFGKPVFYSAAVIGVTSEVSSVQKLAYMGTILFNLRRTANSSFSLGATLIRDPSLSVPVVPLFNYWHRFSSSTELFVDMPQRVMLRQQFSSRTWLMLGTELGGSVAFFAPNSQYLPQHINYSTFELKSGLTFEYRILPKIIISAKGGVINAVSSRSFEQGELSSDYIIDNKVKLAPFINISISVLPFFKPLFH